MLELLRRLLGKNLSKVPFLDHRWYEIICKRQKLRNGRRMYISRGLTLLATRISRYWSGRTLPLHSLLQLMMMLYMCHISIESIFSKLLFSYMHSLF
jgi:hypothetical protein